MFLWWSSTKIVQAIWIRQKTWSLGGVAYFPYISIQKTLKIFLSETSGPFQYNFAEMLLRLSSTKIVQAIWIRQKTWPLGGVAYFPYISIQKTLKIFLSETSGPFQYNFAEMLLRLSSTKIVQAIWIRQKTWPLGGVAYFPYISIQKTLKIFLSETSGPFQYNFAEMLLRLFSTKIVQAIWIRQKTWPPGAGLIFPIYLYRKL